MAKDIEEKTEVKRGPVSYIFLSIIVIGLLAIGALLGYVHFYSRYHAHVDLCVETVARYQYPFLGVYIVEVQKDTVWKKGDQLVLEEPNAYVLPLGALLPLHDDDYGKWHVDWGNTHGICEEEERHEE